MRHRSSPRRVVVFFALLIGVIGVVTPTAHGQPIDGSIQILEVTEAENGELRIEIALPSSVQEFSPTQQDFALAENEQTKPLRVFELNQRVAIVIAIDTSGSMAGGRLEAAKAAASRFVDGIDPNASFAVVGFDDVANPVVDLTQDRTAVQEGIQSLQVAGTETVLWDGMAAAASLLDGADTERPYVVLLADGEDTNSTIDQATAIAQLEDQQAGLYVVAIDSSEADHGALQSAVATVGGQFIPGSADADLGAIYDEVAARLSSRYLLTYNSTPDLERDIRFSVDVGDRILLGGFTIEGEAAAAPDDTAPETETDEPTIIATPLTPIVSQSPGLLGTNVGLYLGAGVLFLFLFVGLLVVLVPRANQTTQLVTAAAGADRIAGVRGQLSDAAERLVAGSSSSGWIERRLDLAGINLRVGEFLTAAAGIAVVLFVAFAALTTPLLALAIAVLVVGGALVYLNALVIRRQQKFADQLTEALSVLYGSLKAGRSLPQAVEFVSTETTPPISQEFRRVVFEVRVGRDLTESMMEVADRMDSPDFAWVAQAVDINRSVGGNLTEVLENVSDTIKERTRIGRQIRSLSSEGRATAWVLLVMPPLISVFLFWRTPENMQRFVGASSGRILLVIALAGMVVGAIWIRSLIKVKY